MQPAEYPDEYLIGVQLFNRGDWFESHDAWEELWHSIGGPQRSFYQGLIQIAIALCHFYNGNARGARRLYHSGLSYLDPYRPYHLGLDLDDFRQQVERCFAPVLAARDEWIAMPDGTAPRITLDPDPARWPAIPAWIREARQEDG